MSTRHHPVSTVASASAVVLVLMLLAALGVSAGEAETDRGDRLNDGSLSFNRYCQSCHGARGEGDGPVAEYLKVPPADLTRISARRDGVFPDEEIHQIIDGRKGVRTHGSTDMPIWGDAFKRTEETESEEVVQQKIANLVIFVKTMQLKTPRAAAD